MTKSSRVGIDDVASLAGVSRTTVSHALSGRRPVAPQTKARILAVIKESGFRPNEVARSLRTQKTNTVALVIPDITNPFYPELARGLQDILEQHEKHVIVCSTDGLAANETSYMESMTARNVDGMVVFSFHLGAADFARAARAGISVVRLGAGLDADDSDTVSSAERSGIAEATRFLVGRGYARIAFIDAPHLNGLGQRLDGYRDALIESGIAVDEGLVVETEYTRRGGVDGMRRLLLLPQPPDAVVCANDLIAIGALDVLREARLRVPEDVALVGFDDIDAASLVTPALTTVSNRAYDMGRAAGGLLISRLSAAYEGPKRHVVLPTTLIVRESA